MVEVIAEFCQNHNGERSILQEMVYAAAESGATFAKIQSMRADDLTHRPCFDEGATDSHGAVQTIRRPYDAEYRRLKPLDLDDDDHHRFVEWCGKAGIKPLTTVFSRSRIPFVASLGPVHRPRCFGIWCGTRCRA
jgi:N,N'-diacetyllegionaminate synthase